MSNDSQLEKMLITAFAKLDSTKDSCKVCVSQSTQVPDINQTNRLLRSSLETIDACDLCKFFIVNKSPMTKSALRFTIDVVRNNINESQRICNDPYCKDIIKHNIKQNTQTLNHLLELYKAIKSTKTSKI